MVRKMTMTSKDENGNELKSEIQNVLNEMELDTTKQLGKLVTDIAEIKKDTSYITKELMRIDGEHVKRAEFDTVQKEYVSKSEFQPVRLLVYGFAGLIFTGFVIGLITIVINK